MTKAEMKENLLKKIARHADGYTISAGYHKSWKLFAQELVEKKILRQDKNKLYLIVKR